MLASCQNTEVPLSSDVDIPQALDQTQAVQGSTEIALWWRSWNDPVLSGLIEQGLRQIHDVRIARSRLEEARANSRLAGRRYRKLFKYSGKTLGEALRAQLSEQEMQENLIQSRLAGAQTLVGL